MVRVPATPSGTVAPALPRKHPATFTKAILDKLAEIVGNGVYLDPFAGVGKIQRIQKLSRQFICVEIEPEWIEQAPIPQLTICADSLKQMKEWRKDGTRFDGIVTSCVYGNRMSDSHEASDGSRRTSYTHLLGRPVSEGSSAAMYFWQPEYRAFHYKAWKRCYQVTRPGGDGFFNVKNFIRDREIVDTVSWHRDTLVSVGWEIMELIKVPTPGHRDGENSEARVDHEVIIKARRA